MPSRTVSPAGACSHNGTLFVSAAKQMKSQMPSYINSLGHKLLEKDAPLPAFGLPSEVVCICSSLT